MTHLHEVSSPEEESNQPHHEHRHPQQDWDAIKPAIDQIRLKGFEAFASELDDIDQAFILGDRCIRCIDEGTPDGIPLAGSGILMSEEQALKAVRHAHADGIYSHEHCGAAALYAKAKGLDPLRADKFGKIWAKHLAEVAGVPYLGHISAKEMHRPEDHHNARIAYYDGTGSFNPKKAKELGLPSGFHISRKFVDRAYALKEAEISANIAMGNHGYGDLITPDEPFLFVVIGDPEGISADELAEELKDIVADSNGRAQILTWTRPDEAAEVDLAA